jgi:photosystem II stability/assembly factor-like uncharacterized protein
MPSGTTSNLYDVVYYYDQLPYNKYFSCGANGTLLGLKSLDSNWTTQSSGTSVDLNSFGSFNHPFYIFGNNGIAVKSFGPSGYSWFTTYTGYQYNLFNGSSSLGKIITIGANGKILMKDLSLADTSWKIIPSGTVNDLKSISLFDRYFWIAGANGTILYSNDTGYTWVQKVSGVTVNLNSIFFQNSLTGIVVGNNGVILKTSNGGINWIQKNSNTQQNLNCVKSFSCISGDKIVLLSTNNGENWNPEPNSPQYNLYSYAVGTTNWWNQSTILFTGENGKIFKRTVDTAYNTNIYTFLKANNIKGDKSTFIIEQHTHSHSLN